ncbi:scpA/B family protein [Mycobacterium xenopi 4042]|uniref:Segregation and condensation protein A n=1 Tax=Mycobacterium xenopi 4042 TaxID=1299334 RepID=X8BIB2_MYCXE|nr:scpA/B family protein [Mycobacterium xenopi 4042]
MEFEVSPQNGFQVRLTNFEGPFDLLLQLIFAHRLDVTEVALHQVTDEFIAYTRAIGPDLELEETTAFLVVAATLLDLKAARLLPAGQVEDQEDLALLEVRDLLFARLLQYRAFKHVAQMFAELEAAALRSYPRAVSVEDRFANLLPEVLLGVDAQRFAQIAAVALTPGRPRWWTSSICTTRRSRCRSKPSSCWSCWKRGASAFGRRFPSWSPTAGTDRDRRPVPGAARTVPGRSGSIRPGRTAWCAPGFMDRRTADQRRLGESRLVGSARSTMTRADGNAERRDEEERHR